MERGGRRETLLTTWKQIAAYLGVTERTAQKWERERGLPVHRVPGGRGRVWASPSELDSWGEAASAAPARVREGGRARRAGVVLLGVVALLVGVVAVVQLSRPDGGEPASFQVQGGMFLVRDAEGRELWRRPLTRWWLQHSPEWGREMAWIGDVCAGPEKEILLVGADSTEPAPVRLYCFDSSGAELWRFEVRREVRTRDEVFRPPYMVRAFAVYPGTPRRLAVVSSHDSYFPTQAAILNGEGKVLSEYWHSGYLYAVSFADLDEDGRPELYLGGTSNAREMATLVVFDPDRVAGASAEPAPYQLLGFEPGTEIVRIFFPRTCVNRAVRPRNDVMGLRWSPPSLLVQVCEGESPEEAITYRFNARLELEDATPSDAFLRLHGWLWQSGRIDHPWSREEEASLRRIIRLTPPDS